MPDNILNSSNYYKKKYIISFYDETDEVFIANFDNVRQICQYKYNKKEITSKIFTLTSVELYRALNREDHFTRMLDGSPMHVYLTLATEDKDIEENEENTEK